MSTAPAAHPEDGGSGMGKPLRLLNHPVREQIPMLLAAIGSKNVELAAEVFNEWQPFLLVPAFVDKAFGESLAAGRAKRDSSPGNLGIAVQTTMLITDNRDAESATLETVRHHAAQYIDGMGARGTNLDRKKDEAAGAVPLDLARNISLIGPAPYVKDRVRAYAVAGVTCLLASPIVGTHAERVLQLTARVTDPVVSGGVLATGFAPGGVCWWSVDVVLPAGPDGDVTEVDSPRLVDDVRFVVSEMRQRQYAGVLDEYVDGAVAVDRLRAFI